MRAYLLSALALMGLGFSVSASAQGNAEAGRNVFMANCMACHAMACNKNAPKLQGVFGRAAGTVADYPYYTDAMKKSGIVWSPERLDSFLADPPKMVPGTLMTFGKVDDAQHRRDLIAFIQRGDTSADLCPR